MCENKLIVKGVRGAFVIIHLKLYYQLQALYDVSYEHQISQSMLYMMSLQGRAPGQTANHFQMASKYNTILSHNATEILGKLKRCRDF